MKRALTLLVPAVLAIGLVACSDDDDSPATTSATTATEVTAPETAAAEATTSTTDGAATRDDGSVSDSQADTLGQIFPNLSRVQIDCLVDELGGAAQAIDPSQAQAAAEACNIDPDDLVPDMGAVSIPDLSDVSIPDNMDEVFAQVFPNLDAEQIDCLVAELGGDFDMTRAAELTETCNIDPADLQPG